MTGERENKPEIMPFTARQLIPRRHLFFSISKDFDKFYLIKVRLKTTFFVAIYSL